MSKISEQERQEILNRIKLNEEKAAQNEKKIWQEDYNNYSFEKKKKIWLIKFWQDVKWQGESSEDELAIFTHENYLIWKQKESDFDLILKYVAEELDNLYSNDGRVVNEIYKRIFKIGE